MRSTQIVVVSPFFFIMMVFPLKKIAAAGLGFSIDLKKFGHPKNVHGFKKCSQISKKIIALTNVHELFKMSLVLKQCS